MGGIKRSHQPMIAYEEYFSWPMVCMTNIQTHYKPSGIVIWCPTRSNTRLHGVDVWYTKLTLDREGPPSWHYDKCNRNRCKKLHTADASVKLGGKGNGAHVQKDISHLRCLNVTDMLLFVVVRIFILSGSAGTRHVRMSDYMGYYKRLQVSKRASTNDYCSLTEAERWSPLHMISTWSFPGSIDPFDSNLMRQFVSDLAHIYSLSSPSTTWQKTWH